jgi:hypothetical protein
MGEWYLPNRLVLRHNQLQFQPWRNLMEKRKLSLDKELISRAVDAPASLYGGTELYTDCCADPTIVNTQTQTVQKNCFEVSIAACTMLCQTDWCTYTC